MKIEKHLTIEDGMIIGKVKTDVVGSECEFEVCSKEEYEKMDEDAAGKALVYAMWESGVIDVYF